MSSRIVAALLGTVCLSAAGGGAYLAMRQNRPAAQPATVQPPTTPSSSSGAAEKGVAETEAVVEPAPVAPTAAPAPVAEEPSSSGTRVARATPDPKPARPAKPEAPRPADPPHRTATRAVETPAAAPVRGQTPAPVPDRPAVEAPTPVAEAPVEPARVPEQRQAAREPQFDEVVLPASSVLGLQVETPLSSERTRLEDRVEARVTRDVTSGGHVAIPAGSRVIGSVTLVERGGKMKERARLGVRFHTLVLADGREVPLRTEGIIREGDSPSNESARKIGGAAVGGAILGAILGGGKGAVMGGAAGAAGGSAAVMAGDRNAATLPAGTVVSVRLAEPATIDVERPPQ
jgi:type IV secretory pathway VirB10-like protein